MVLIFKGSIPKKGNNRLQKTHGYIQVVDKHLISHHLMCIMQLLLLFMQDRIPSTISLDHHVKSQGRLFIFHLISYYVVKAM